MMVNGKKYAAIPNNQLARSKNHIGNAPPVPKPPSKRKTASTISRKA